jgi:hypothetical protein
MKRRKRTSPVAGTGSFGVYVSVFATQYTITIKSRKYEA